jgi:succinyl-CoA synthetase alpha subunit
MRFGHAGAIVEEGKGTAASKTKALQDAGISVARHFPEIGKLAREALNTSKT